MNFGLALPGFQKTLRALDLPKHEKICKEGLCA